MNDDKVALLFYELNLFCHHNVVFVNVLILEGVTGCENV